jgi:hypothetical protein
MKNRAKTKTIIFFMGIPFCVYLYWLFEEILSRTERMSTKIVCVFVG